MPKETKETKKDALIVLDFDGFLKVSAENAMFYCIGSDKPDISGLDWIVLSDEEKSCYLLDFDSANSKACDGTFGTFTVSVETID